MPLDRPGEVLDQVERSTGILASAIVGGGIGDYLQPYCFGGFWGVLFGGFAFTCARLWLVAKALRIRMLCARP